MGVVYHALDAQPRMRADAWLYDQVSYGADLSLSLSNVLHQGTGALKALGIQRFFNVFTNTGVAKRAVFINVQIGRAQHNDNRGFSGLLLISLKKLMACHARHIDIKEQQIRGFGPN